MDIDKIIPLPQQCELGQGRLELAALENLAVADLSKAPRA